MRYHALGTIEYYYIYTIINAQIDWNTMLVDKMMMMMMMMMMIMMIMMMMMTSHDNDDNDD